MIIVNAIYWLLWAVFCAFIFAVMDTDKALCCFMVVTLLTFFKGLAEVGQTYVDIDELKKSSVSLLIAQGRKIELLELEIAKLSKV